MSSIAPTLQAFFTARLGGQQQVSPRTVASYRDSLCLLLCYLQDTTGKTPSRPDWEDLGEPAISAFWITSSTNATTVPGPATCVSPPSGRCSATQRCAIPNTLSSSSMFWRYPPNALSGPPSATSTLRRLPRRSTPPTRPGGRAAETEPFSNLLPKLACESQNSSGSTAPISTSASAPTSPAPAKDADTEPFLSPAQPRIFCASGPPERAGRPNDPLFPTRTGRRLSRDAIEQRADHPCRHPRPPTSLPANQETASSRPTPHDRDGMILKHRLIPPSSHCG